MATDGGKVRNTVVTFKSVQYPMNEGRQESMHTEESQAGGPGPEGRMRVERYYQVIERSGRRPMTSARV
jgi:hypothetical protein